MQDHQDTGLGNQSGVFDFTGSENVQRVMVIGSPGAGKSTFARRLAAITSLPLFHLDAERWLPGWIPREEADWQERQVRLVEQERWIIDGNHGDSLDLRMGRADTVIWLDYPTSICLWRGVRRMIAQRGRVLPDGSPGCPEAFELEFLTFIAMFRRRNRSLITTALRGYAGRVLRFEYPGQAENFLTGLASRQS